MSLSDQTHETLVKLRSHLNREMKRWVTENCGQLTYPNDYRSPIRKEVIIMDGKIYTLPSSQDDFDTMANLLDEIERIVGSTVFS